jgi:hypothetical protein
MRKGICLKQLTEQGPGDSTYRAVILQAQLLRNILVARKGNMGELWERGNAGTVLSIKKAGLIFL